MHQPKPSESNVAAEIEAVLDQQVAAWNRGDLVGFMEGYARGADTRFASGADVTLGWEPVFARYQKRYGGGQGMGQLTFSDVDITPLGADSAQVFGRWRLERDGTSPNGLFTLLFRRLPAGWRIVSDHTSAAAP